MAMTEQSRMRESPVSARLAGARRDADPNVTGAERWISALAGGGLALWGLRRGGAAGAGAAALGAALVARSAARRDPVKRLFSANALERRVAQTHGWSTAAIASRAVTMNCPAAEVYAIWRDLENLPRWMDNVVRIEKRDDKTSHWVVKGPAGSQVEFDSVIVADEPGKRIAWETRDGVEGRNGGVRSTGWVEFEDWPNGRGCVVRAMIAYEPPAGQFGRVAAKALRRAPEIQVRTDLRRLKQMIETGEIATGASRRTQAKELAV